MLDVIHYDVIVTFVLFFFFLLHLRELDEN